MKYQKLILFLLLTLFSAGMIHAQSGENALIVITADADADTPMEVTVVNAAGNSSTVTVAPGESFSPPAGFFVSGAKGKGSVSLGGGNVIRMSSSTTSIALSTNPTTAQTGVQATSGSVTLFNTSNPTAVVTVTAGGGGTADSFAAVSIDGAMTTSSTPPADFVVTSSPVVGGSGTRTLTPTPPPSLTPTPTTPIQNVVSPS